MIVWCYSIFIVINLILSNELINEFDHFIFVFLGELVLIFEYEVIKILREGDAIGHKYFVFPSKKKKIFLNRHSNRRCAGNLNDWK